MGLGRGGSPYEYVRLGMTDSEAAERQYEALEILLGIWGADEDYAHEGKCFKFPAVYTVPRPLSPHPPSGSPPGRRTRSASALSMDWASRPRPSGSP